MFINADRDGDGKISYTEFQVMMNPQNSIADFGTPKMSNVKRVTINTDSDVANEESDQSNSNQVKFI